MGPPRRCQQLRRRLSRRDGIMRRYRSKCRGVSNVFLGKLHVCMLLSLFLTWPFIIIIGRVAICQSVRHLPHRYFGLLLFRALGDYYCRLRIGSSRHRSGLYRCGACTCRPYLFLPWLWASHQPGWRRCRLARLFLARLFFARPWTSHYR